MLVSLTSDLAGEVVDGGVERGNAAISGDGALALGLGGHDQEGNQEQEDADGLGVVLAEDALAVERHGLGPAGKLSTRVGGREGDALSGHC